MCRHPKTGPPSPGVITPPTPTPRTLGCDWGHLTLSCKALLAHMHYTRVFCFLFFFKKRNTNEINIFPPSALSESSEMPAALNNNSVHIQLRVQGCQAMSSCKHRVTQATRRKRRENQKRQNGKAQGKIHMCAPTANLIDSLHNIALEYKVEWSGHPHSAA